MAFLGLAARSLRTVRQPRADGLGSMTVASHAFCRRVARPNHHRALHTVRNQSSAALADDYEEDVEVEGNPVWEDVSPHAWRNSIYSPEAASTPHGVLYQEQLDLFRGFPNADKTTLIEVGCGTAELFSKVHENYGACLGIELSPAMIECAYECNPHLKDADNVQLVNGNAMNLSEIVDEAGLDPFAPKTLCIVMNTIGILPDHVRVPVLKQMWKVAGTEGQVVLGCWAQDQLRVGFEEYYAKNPALVGAQCTEKDFDFENGKFLSTSGYSSHWFSEKELTDYLTWSASPYDVKIEFKHIGVGVFAIAKLVED